MNLARRVFVGGRGGRGVSTLVKNHYVKSTVGYFDLDMQAFLDRCPLSSKDNIPYSTGLLIYFFA